MHQVLEKAEDDAIERESFSSPSFKRRSIRVQITVSETPQEYDFSHSVTSGTMIVSVPPPFQCDVTTCILNGLPSTVTVNVTSVTAGSGGDDAAPLDLKMSVRVMYGPDIRAQEETVDLPLSLAGTVMPSANPALLTPSSGKELYRVRECVSGAVRFAIHSLLVLENRNPLMILPTNQSACLPARPFFFFSFSRAWAVRLSICLFLVADHVHDESRNSIAHRIVCRPPTDGCKQRWWQWAQCWRRKRGRHHSQYVDLSILHWDGVQYPGARRKALLTFVLFLFPLLQEGGFFLSSPGRQVAIQGPHSKRSSGKLMAAL